jgi:hypothetical protein
VSIKAFYDGSGKVNDPSCSFLNLGSFTGSETAWTGLKLEWLDVLERHAAPKSPRGKRYFHSKEAMHNKGGYAGWNSDRVSKLIVALLNLLGHTEQHADPLAISCSVNLADYKKIKANIPALRSPEAICLDACFGLVVRHPYRDSGIQLFFDRGESFYPILKKLLNVKDRGRAIWWAQYISSISEIEDMREWPEIQTADLLAWLANRYCTHGSGDRWGSRFFSMFIVKKHYYEYIDEQALLSLFEPDGQMKPGIQLPAVRIKAPFVPETTDE